MKRGKNKKHPLTEIKKYISPILEEFGYNSSKFCRVGGIDESTLGKILNGQSIPNVETLIHIAKILSLLDGQDWKDHAFFMIVYLERDMREFL
jgi:predicted transcriptional regulator